jgi:hypothetical protein
VSGLNTSASLPSLYAKYKKTMQPSPDGYLYMHCFKLERETGFPVDPYPIDSTEVFGTPLCLTDWIMYYPCCLGKRFLTTPLQVLVFWSYRLFILPDHCLHAPGQQQPCGD